MASNRKVSIYTVLCVHYRANLWFHSWWVVRMNMPRFLTWIYFCRFGHTHSWPQGGWVLIQLSVILEEWIIVPKTGKCRGLQKKVLAVSSYSPPVLSVPVGTVNYLNNVQRCPIHTPLLGYQWLDWWLNDDGFMHIYLVVFC